MTAPRIDGRRPDETRPVSIEPDVTKFADGSCTVSFGDTRVMCTALIENRVPGWLRGQGRGWVTAEYAMLPCATPQRTVRDVNRHHPASRSLEIQRLIGRALRAVIDLSALGERQIVIDCDVLQADGGTRTAAVTGGFVALARAVAAHMKAGKMAKPVVRDTCAATSVGLVEGRAVLDLNYLEDSQAETDMNVVMSGGGGMIEIQGTAETEPFAVEALHTMLALAQNGIDQLTAIQKDFIDLDTVTR